MRASGGQGRVSLVDRKTSRRIEMTQFAELTPSAADYDSTIIGALELSEKKWVLAVQLPGVKRHSRHVVEARGDELAAFVERLKARCAVAGHNIKRVILTHEAGRDGFWLARFLVRRGVEVHVMQPSSLPVDRRARRAKTDVIDVEMLLRTLMAWLRGEPRVCSMVPIPNEADEEARRAHREREDGDPLPQMARARIDRLELVLKLIEEVEATRDAVLKKAAPADEAERMIRSLA